MILPSLVLLLVIFSGTNAIRKALPEEFPFQVLIRNTFHLNLCGGAIITKDWVLTEYNCVKGSTKVYVNYRKADSNLTQNSIESEIIVKENIMPWKNKTQLALIKLKKSIEFSETAKQAKLPIQKTQFYNTTKLSGWKFSETVNFQPNLYVMDKYYVILTDCRSKTGIPVQLTAEEFCGEPENSVNDLTFSGAIVSKADIVLGILDSSNISPVSPLIFVKVSEYEEWIKNVLDRDAGQVHWVNKVPLNTANSQKSIIITLLISSIFIRYI